MSRSPSFRISTAEIAWICVKPRLPSPKEGGGSLRFCSFLFKTSMKRLVKTCLKKHVWRCLLSLTGVRCGPSKQSRNVQFVPYAACNTVTFRRNGRSVWPMPWSHLSLSCSALSCSTSLPVRYFHLEPRPLHANAHQALAGGLDRAAANRKPAAPRRSACG